MINTKKMRFFIMVFAIYLSKGSGVLPYKARNRNLISFVCESRWFLCQPRREFLGFQKP